jgi:hypothetical protein
MSTVLPRVRVGGRDTAVPQQAARQGGGPGGRLAAQARLAALPEGLTLHALRRAFASLRGLLASFQHRR